MTARFVISALVALLAAAAAPARTPPYAELVRLYAYDASKPLAVRGVRVRTESGVAVHEVSYASPRGGRVPAYLVLPPEATGPFPAVVFTPGGNGTKDDFLVEAVALAQRGVLSLLPDPPFSRVGGRPLITCSKRDLDNYVRTIVDVRRGIDLLVARDDVDPARIAHVGFSYGATIGAILSGVEKRLRADVVVSGGADQLGFVARQCASLPRKQLRAMLEALAPVDPTPYVRHAAPTRLFFQNGTLDGFVPRRTAAALHAAATRPKTVRWYRAPHELNEQAKKDREGWLLAQLQAPATADAQGTSRVPERCLKRSEQAIRFRTTDGIRLAGGLLGKGKTGVVLVPQSNHDYCGFVPFGRLLAARGYLALSVSLRNHGSSGREEVPNQHHPRDVAAAVKELRRRGATKVFLIGASLGGTAVLTAAPDIDPPIAGVVDLSGPAEFTDMEALEAMPRLTAPALFVVGKFDTAFVADTRAMYRAAASTDKKLVVRPGGEHGTALVDSRSGVVRNLIYGFLRSH